MFRHHRHISTAIALTLALSAAASSAASARFAPDQPPATSQTQAQSAVNPPSRDVANPAVRAIQAQGARVARELAARDALAGRATLSPPPPSIIKISQPDGFAWADAGIGAGATIALVLVLLGSGLYLTHRRTARLSQPS
jgi:hypothetical protein